MKRTFDSVLNEAFTSTLIICKKYLLIFLLISEMEMGYELYCTMKEKGEVKEGHIGLRINSQYGAGAIEATSTATATSKFGLPLKDTDFDELVSMFRKWPALDTLHSHVGSQGVDLHLMVGGVKCIVDLADRINHILGHNQVPLAASPDS